MKVYLIPEEGQFYKANMHTHSVVSDGIHTPEEIKKLYQEQGYSVVAFTDHDVMVAHNDLTDEHFLAITSFETETDHLPAKTWERCATYHMNFFAKNPEETYYPCANPAYARIGHSAEYVQDYYTGDYTRKYSAEGMNEVIADANAHGYYVCLNHPDWSLQHYPDYAGLEGIHSVEVYNTGCERDGYNLDASEHVLHDLLCLGKRVFPIASDDSHAVYDLFGGWICVKAPALNYQDYMDAFGRGDFYASWGPAIESLVLEDGILKVDCSPVAKVYMRTNARFAGKVTGDGLTHAEFDVRSFIAQSRDLGEEGMSFIRLVLIDAEGNRAVTRGYFVDEFPKETV